MQAATACANEFFVLPGAWKGASFKTSYLIAGTGPSVTRYCQLASRGFVGAGSFRSAPWDDLGLNLSAINLATRMVCNKCKVCVGRGQHWQQDIINMALS